jgi:hypothetical protein
LRPGSLVSRLGHQARISMQAMTTAERRMPERGRTIWRFACLILLGALLAGCDKCGDWWSPTWGDSQACRQQAPRPQ